MSLKLYGNLVSQPCRAVAWLLKTKGVGFELIFTVPPRDLSPEFLRLNPNAKVPVLQDGDFSLFESHAILTYLAEKYKWTDVYPTDLQARAKVNEHLHWHHTNTRVGTSKVFAPIMHRSVGKATPEQLALIPQREENISKFVSLLETFLDRPFIAHSEQPTLADFACYCELVMYEFMEVFDYTKFPKTHAWMLRMKALPYHDDVHEPVKEVLAKFKILPVPQELLQ